jgi:uncharacterized protein with PQ loop repeat
VVDVDAAFVLGWLATVAFLVRLLPQPLRLIRTGVPDGVSCIAVMNIALTELAWLLYGFIEGLVPVWAVSLPALPLGLWTVVLLRHRITRRDLVVSGLWLGAIGVGFLTGTLAVILAVSVLVNYGPQVLTAIRGDHLEGLAPATWLLALVDAGLWGAYGVAVGDPALLGYCVILTLFALIILWRIWRTRVDTGDTGDVVLATDLAT